MSIAEKEKPTLTPLQALWQSTSSFEDAHSQSRYTSEVVMVSIFIGPWAKHFRLDNGAPFPPGSNVFVWHRIWWLTLFGLAICRVFYELPEPTTERAGTLL
jgi:hypothetical protein